ncbi:hypothetical protein EYF80_060696 [Liparis tanakae]|uniref:Uncharacterized protein n=1 Tax=Liparis tanakae TaxID=230148 RepID=A0A4Z2EJW2_9TELE|nr:hypothetical protein EYF80_060696 [Liparis tanakae]
MNKSTALWAGASGSCSPARCPRHRTTTTTGNVVSKLFFDEHERIANTTRVGGHFVVVRSAHSLPADSLVIFHTEKKRYCFIVLKRVALQNQKMARFIPGSLLHPDVSFGQSAIGV